MELIDGYDKNKFIQSLEILKNILINDNLRSDKSINLLNNIFVNIRDKMGTKKKLIYDMNSSEIQEKIEEFLPVKTKEKNEFGEVFTPPELIDEMLDILPISVWKNPNLKWLDPANGIGNFPMKVFERLDKYLSSVNGYENEQKRKNHIIKNMLYMVELNSTNFQVCKKIFKI